MAVAGLLPSNITLAQIVDASEADRRTAVDMLAMQLVTHFGAPDLAAARLAAEQ